MVFSDKIMPTKTYVKRTADKLVLHFRLQASLR